MACSSAFAAVGGNILRGKQKNGIGQIPLWAKRYEVRPVVSQVFLQPGAVDSFELDRYISCATQKEDDISE